MRTTLITACVAALAVAVPGAAIAISSYNSQPAPERTEVGAFVAQWDNDGDPTTPDRVDWVCSGTMISDDVYLTAAHCTTDWPEGVRMGVSRSQDVEADLDAAFAAGLRADALFDAVAVEGTPHTEPGYPGTSADSHDIAVLTFDSAAAREVASRWPAFTPARLPSAGQLSRLGPRRLDRLSWLVVGYGTEEAHRGPGGHTHPGGGVRKKAELGFSALNKTWIRLAMNESRGFGGACYGDSGGPNYATIGGRRILAGTTITGEVPCYATNVAYRMDAPTARAFLSKYVELP
ncbi:MAG: S1 family peptidase [Actinomycetota bacterium]|nr:S1 family peptidase [Actinomycetota bacterium]